MYLEKFNIISGVLLFDDRNLRPRKRETEKIASIRELIDKWMAIYSMLYNPETNPISANEKLVAFRKKVYSASNYPENQLRMI